MLVISSAAAGLWGFLRGKPMAMGSGGCHWALGSLRSVPVIWYRGEYRWFWAIPFTNNCDDLARCDVFVKFSCGIGGV